jgi:dienelactone hydrolase
VALRGVLLLPRGEAPAGGFPAIVALHGCGGMYSSLPSRRDALQIRLRTMAEMLVGEGYLVLFPDSFRPRGRESICAESLRVRTLTTAVRRLDVLAALGYLQSRPDVAPDRIALLGWSHGGSTLLSSLDANAAPVRGFRAQGTELPYFRAGVALYPGCLESLRSPTRFANAAPLLLLVGGSDDWTSPQACERLAAQLHDPAAPVRLVEYPDTYHGFDGPDSQRPMHLDLPNGVHPGKGVTVAVNPSAREDAYRQVKAFLRAALVP